MSKILDANCDANGKVTVAGIEVVGAVVLSEGNQASEGVAVFDGTKVWYLTSSATDIKTTIEKVSNALSKIGDILTSIGAGMTGPTTAPPGTLAADVAEVDQIVTDLNDLKEALK